MLVQSAGWLALLALCECGCDPTILIGRDEAPDGAMPLDEAAHAASPPDALALDGGTAAEAGSGLSPLAVPWSTGFEGAPGDSWIPDSPSCYTTGGASFRIVTSPVHSGQHAAAFTVDTAIASPSQTRCLEEGVLPAVAYYGAWYYVPAQATNISNWNMLHFQGADVANGAAAHGLWDVSLESASDGTLHAVVYDFLRKRLLQTSASIPVATWVYLEVFLRRAADATGEFTLRTNGQVALDLTGLTTDDSQWGQWLVGNYAMALTPPSSTVYVDDVSIGLVSSGP